MEVVHPATLSQVHAFHTLGLRARLLTLPVMMAFVVSLIWRHLGSMCKAVRVAAARRDALEYAAGAPQPWRFFTTLSRTIARLNLFIESASGAVEGHRWPALYSLATQLPFVLVLILRYDPQHSLWRQNDD